MNVGKDTSCCNCDVTKEFAELLVISDSKLNVTGDDPSLLVITSSVASKLQNLSCKIL